MHTKFWVFWGAVAVLSLSVEVSAQQGVRWEETSVDAAKRRAAQTGQLVLVHFWSPSCVPCMKMERNVFSQPEVAEALGRNYVTVKINADHFPHTCRQYGITALPTDLVLGIDGQPLRRFQGEAPANIYVARLNEVAAEIRRPPATYAQQPASPSGLDAGPLASRAPERPAEQPNWGSYANSAPVDDGDRRARQTPIRSTIPDRYAAQAPPAAAPIQQEANPRYARQVPGPQAPVQQETQQPQWQAYGPAAAPPSQAPLAQGPAARPPLTNMPLAQAPIVPQGPPAQAPLRQQPPIERQAMAPSVPGPGYQNYQMPVAPNYQVPQQQIPMARQDIPVSEAPPAPVAATSPAPVQQAPVQQGSPVAAPDGNPPLGLDGYCPIELCENRRWVVGDRKWGAIHRGRTYLFAGPEQQRQFLADADRYAPVISGDDVVFSVDQGQSVAGRREHGIFYHGRVYLFSSEDSLMKFSKDSTRYANQVMQSMRSTPMYR